MNRLAPLGSPSETERSPLGSGYSTRDVATLLGLSVSQVRSYVRAGFLSPGQGARGEYRFSFQDLILLRTAKGLTAARVPHRRILAALTRLREQLPEDRPLTGVRISAQGHQVVVRDGRDVWAPESGQWLLDFEVAELARGAASLPRPETPRPAGDDRDTEQAPDAAAWFERGVELENEDPGEAEVSYRRALAIDPDLADAHLNLGRLLHEGGQPAAAEEHYRKAWSLLPDDATAAFNLGTALQDLDRYADAAEAYEKALALDPAFADAHYNLAVVFEHLGRKRSAIRHLKSYRALTT
jgi:tetratricopeptide (TPR) repeat protein